ncbi:MAG: N-6 DNA methylase [Devosia sp.]|nr:N-6 DNA methylase [Devosia sp.]
MARDIFSAAGVHLPGGLNGRRRRAAPEAAARLVSPKVIAKQLGLVALDLDKERVEAASDYARRARSAGFVKQKEISIRQLFFEQILGKVLGYTQYDPDTSFTLGFERRIRNGSVDVALGRFSDVGGDVVVAPLEMKGPSTFDLDAIMPGRGKSPVQQAWEYAIDAPGVKWVMVCNCLELRLYGFGRGRDVYETFSLTRLDEKAELERLVLLLEARRFLGGATEALLRETDTSYRDVSNDLYLQYSGLRNRVFLFLVDSADGPRLQRAAAVELSQKLLDRVLFIAFAGGTGLLPPKLLERAATSRNDFQPVPVWTNFLAVFRHVDRGSGPPLDINGYNGGLFADDPVLDRVILPDPLARDIADLGKWDFGSEVPVTVLGHLFEQSITDLERMRAEAEGKAPPKVGKKKREGVVYTPDHVTRFLVERTIGVTLGERFADLLERHTGKRTLPDRNAPPLWQDDEAEKPFWRDYLEVLRGLTVLDPACGSGAFLAAAFDALAAEYLRVTERLAALGDAIDFDAFDEILTRNLYGVDLNVESVEITRLSLWLKTARQKHRLASLDDTIRDGDSIVGDRAFSPNPFPWDGQFDAIRQAGGFDVIIGNPPYVRMEVLKPVKPYLAQRYTVADERTDLYAYFFERAVNLLKPGGRLGFISSSTFFRTGSGGKLRLLLAERTDIEAVVDFGDAQLFEGVTTYPAILALKKLEPGAVPGGELRFLNVRGDVPTDLGKAFEQDARSMPRARLGGGSWRFEAEVVARVRDKIVAGRKTLGEVYGAPLYGIKTGLNDAFIVDSETRDRLVARDPKSAELLKPFLKGENIKRWRVESEGLFLINIPRGKVKIDDYPAIRDHLAQYRAELEARATQQEWFELQQAQLAYQPKFEQPKIVYPHFQDRRMFALEVSGALSNDKTYIIPVADKDLLGLLNSRLAWFFVVGEAPAVRNGWREMRVQYVEKLPLPDWLSEDRRSLADAALRCTTAAIEYRDIAQAVANRIRTDLGCGLPLTGKLSNWPQLDFAAFRAEIKRAFKTDIPVKERGEWEEYLRDNAAKLKALTGEIEAAEREIDRLVYDAFGLTTEEIAIVEASIAGQT